MEKHNLKSGFSIYFADVHFEKQVYAFGSGLGFTSVIYAYCWAEIRKKLRSWRLKSTTLTKRR